MRGNLLCANVCRLGIGSIPAYAGEPRLPLPHRTGAKVYPRVCGGTTTAPSGVVSAWGLSPRMRGNPDGLGDRKPATGSIPAYAGEPGGRAMPPDDLAVYPRVCGGTRPQADAPKGAVGLSPRMRGNLGKDGCMPGIARSIPAYAGEPAESSRSSNARAVYPRVCGGTCPSLPHPRSG